MDNLNRRKDFNDESERKWNVGMFNEIPGKLFGSGSHGEERMRKRLRQWEF